MDCDEATLLLLREVDEPLAAEARAAVAKHLEACAACREGAAAQAAVSSVLRSRPPSAPPARFAALVAARIEAGRGWFGLADWRVWTFRLAPVAAALMVIAVAYGGASSESSPSLDAVVESWAAGERPASDLPATSLFWQADVSGESLLVAVLTLGPDEALETGQAAGQEGVK